LYIFLKSANFDFYIFLTSSWLINFALFVIYYHLFTQI